MKLLVDNLPEKCCDCPFCAQAAMMTPLGVPKQVCLCTIYTTFIPQNPQQEPKTIDKDKSPIENDCLCSDGKAHEIPKAETPKSSILQFPGK